jgi:hypothetical protein
MPATLEEIRHHLCVLARRNAWTVPHWRDGTPNRWHPLTVRDPSSGEFFTEAGALEFVAELLEKGHQIEEVVLEKPPGRLGYVMQVEMGTGRPLLYIKLQLGRGQIICRSFHDSKFHNERNRS